MSHHHPTDDQYDETPEQETADQAAQERREALPGLGYTEKFAHGDTAGEETSGAPEPSESEAGEDESDDDAPSGNDEPSASQEGEHTGAQAPPPASSTPWTLSGGA